MIKSRKNKLLILSVLFWLFAMISFCLTFGFNRQKVNADAQEEIKTVSDLSVDFNDKDFYFKGYALKWDETVTYESETSQEAGLRFKFWITQNLYTHITGNGLTTGVAILPAHYLTDGSVANLTVNATGNPITVTTTNAWVTIPDGNKTVGDITYAYQCTVYLNEMPREFFSSDIAVRGYIVSGETYYYSNAEGEVARSLAYIANIERNDTTSDFDDDKKEAFKEALLQFPFKLDNDVTTKYYGDTLKEPTESQEGKYFVGYSNNSGTKYWDIENGFITGKTGLKTVYADIYEDVVPVANGQAIYVDGKEITTATDLDGAQMLTDGKLSGITANDTTSAVAGKDMVVTTATGEMYKISTNVYSKVLNTQDEAVKFFYGTKNTETVTTGFIDFNDDAEQFTDALNGKSVALNCDVDVSATPMRRATVGDRSVSASVAYNLNLYNTSSYSLEGNGHTFKFNPCGAYGGLFGICAREFLGVKNMYIEAKATATYTYLDSSDKKTHGGTSVLEYAYYKNWTSNDTIYDNVVIKVIPSHWNTKLMGVNAATSIGMGSYGLRFKDSAVLVDFTADVLKAFGGTNWQWEGTPISNDTGVFDNFVYIIPNQWVDTTGSLSSKVGNVSFVTAGSTQIFGANTPNIDFTNASNVAITEMSTYALSDVGTNVTGVGTWTFSAASAVKDIVVTYNK